jgi:hypothetical protein
MGDYTEGRLEYATVNDAAKRLLLAQAREVAMDTDTRDRDPATVSWALGIAFAALDESRERYMFAALEEIDEK